VIARQRCIRRIVPARRGQAVVRCGNEAIVR
jgi:hypothetical protein